MDKCHSATETMRYVVSKHRLKNGGVRTPKFISAPVYSCTHWLRARNSLPSPAFGLIYEGAIGPPRETTSLCKTPDFRTRSTEQKDRVKEEIGIMRRLANPNVIKFIDAFENSREIILGKSLPAFLL
jgi:serine/threonine protein kinase